VRDVDARKVAAEVKVRGVVREPSADAMVGALSIGVAVLVSGALVLTVEDEYGDVEVIELGSTSGRVIRDVLVDHYGKGSA